MNDRIEEINPPLLHVHHVGKNAEPALDFQDEVWVDINPELIDHHMGTEPKHRPLTQFKIGYNSQSILLVFRVIDKFIRAKETRYQGPVFQDSCVEFFFSPGPDVSEGYFNLEVNCCGTALFEFHPGGNRPFIQIPETAFNTVRLIHHLKGPIDPEIESALVWSIGYRIPVDILSPFCSVARPEPGVTWRANFHKCADLSSHPHWLTWAKVNYPEPRFHLPEYFGVLRFE